MLARTQTTNSRVNIQSGVRSRQSAHAKFSYEDFAAAIFKKSILALVVVAITVFLLLMVMPIISMLQFSGFSRIWQSVAQFDGLAAISLSLYTTAITALFTFLIGTPVAFLLSRYRGLRAVRALSVVFQLPIALPPSIAGIALLLFFGTNGIGGRLLAALGVNIIFTPIAVMIAQFFVSCPLYVQSLRLSANAVPEELFEAAYVNGADAITTVVRFIVPMLRPAIVSAIIVSYIRSLGEFGATLLFAGNMAGATSTMPLHIYTLMQSDVRLSAAFSIVLISIAAVIVVVIKGLLGREEV
jgi:molybdate transport system permease protein